MKKIGIAILGCGTVGSEVVRLLARDGSGLELVWIAVRSAGQRRSRFIPRRLVTTRADRLVRDERVAVVVELIGGTGAAWRLQQTALRAGKSIVTANKALIDAHGDRLFELARRQGAHLAFHDRRKVMKREVNPVIGHTVLRKIVCAYFFAAVPRADLVASVLGKFLMLAFLHLLQQA